MRGLTVDELANTSQWWNGPEFLKRSEDEWTECKFNVPTSKESNKEGKNFQERRLVAMKSLRAVKRMLTATMPERKEFGG